VSALALAAGLADASQGQDIRWQQLSSKNGELPAPGQSHEQTGAVVGDFDNDGVNDFILSFRQQPPALVWYRRTATGWDRYVIEKEYLTIEAGGAVYDIDGDGDLDVVFGGDWQSNQVWWWENPYPNFDPNVSWKRHTIKKDGKTQHHDQVFADLLGKGKAQLAFWNQNAKTIFLAEIPGDPRNADGWPLVPVYSGEAGESSGGTFRYPEGMSAYDVDADGRLDLLAGNTWFKHCGGTLFKAIRVADVGGLIFAGYFLPGKYPQIVIAPGDAVGPLRWYQCAGNAEEPKDWVGHDLLERNLVHGHSLQLADFNRDGNLDIFCAEMAKWSENKTEPDNPGATAWIFYGDGAGHFLKTELAKGQGFHEARARDLDGDGDVDILNKPYNWDVPRVDVWLNNGTRAGARGVGTSRSFLGPVGLQLYSLRDTLSKNVPLGLQITRNLGFVEVELADTCGLPPEKLRSLLEFYGLRPIAAIFDYDTCTKAPEKVLAEAQTLGLQYAGCAWVPHQGDFTEAQCREAAAAFNRTGQLLAKHGRRFFYHNHGYEFQPYKDGTLFDLLAAETKPEFVAFELDIFWAAHPGQDPVQLLQRFPNRWELVHLKDMRRGTQTGLLTGSTDAHNDVPLGAGQLDLRSVLRAAARLGVKHYFIEDESPAVLAQIPQSLSYLESLSW
jgi:sugar phosphate isomerase/epimerase